MTIDRPGIYTIPAADYHADPCPEPSLSCSLRENAVRLVGAARLLRAPAPQPTRRVRDRRSLRVGTAAHALLLEGRDTMVVIDAPDWRTKAAKEQRDAARDSWPDPAPRARRPGRRRDGRRAARSPAPADRRRRADVHRRPAEQTLVWCEDDVWCRARLRLAADRPVRDRRLQDNRRQCQPRGVGADDVQRRPRPAGRVVPARAARHYRRTARRPGRLPLRRPGDDRAVRPQCHRPEPRRDVLAEKKCLYALEQFREALASGDWRGYPRRTAYATLPAWEEARWLEKELR